jgi:hypothetical protein
MFFLRAPLLIDQFIQARFERNNAVNEPIGGDWQMLASSHKYTKTSAWAAQFDVPVQANGDALLKYRIQAKW